MAESSVSPVHVACTTCGAPLARHPSRIKRCKHGRYFCDRACRDAYGALTPALDLTGQRFGRWIALEPRRRESDPFQQRHWLCRCDCGTEKIVNQRSLVCGDTLSCGCRLRDRAQEPKQRRRRERRSTPEYGIWTRMRQRCMTPTHLDYPRYGGRGITICPEWNSFERFLADMGLRPTPQHSIDRIDNDGPYSAANCRWGTKKEQSDNRGEFNRLLTFQGKTMGVTDWARELGMGRTTLLLRLKAGWSIERALSEPVRAKPRRPIR